MNGCQTCGGYGMHHDPIAHDWESADMAPGDEPTEADWATADRICSDPTNFSGPIARSSTAVEIAQALATERARVCRGCRADAIGEEAAAHARQYAAEELRAAAEWIPGPEEWHNGSEAYDELHRRADALDADA